MSNDEIVNIKTKRILRNSLLSALIVFISGYVVMSILWQIEGPNYHGLYTFYYYRAATLGDGLFLSLLVGASFSYLSLYKPLSSKHRRTSHLVGAVTGLIGVGIQASWLISDVTNSNWTMPQTHHFAFSGWYHAAFFVSMFYTVGMLLTRIFLLRRVNIKSKPYRELNTLHLSKISYTLIWMAGSGYLFMHVIDDFCTQENYIYVFLATLLILIIFTSIFSIISSKKLTYQDIVCILSGIFTSFGFGLCVYLAFSEVWLPIMSALITSALVFPNRKRISVAVSSFILIVMPAFMLDLALLCQQNILDKIILACLLVVIPLIISREQKTSTSDIGIKGYEHNYYHGFLFLIIIAAFSFYLNFNNPDILSNLIIYNISPLLASVVMPYYIKNIFNIQIESENKKSQDFVDKIRVIVFAKIFLIIIATVPFYFICLYRLIGIQNTKTLWESPLWTNQNTLAIVIFLISVSILYLIGSNLIRNKLKWYWVTASIILLVTSYSSIIFWLVSYDMPAITTNYIIYIVPAIFIIIGVASLISKGFYSNMVTIQGFKGLLPQIITSIIIFFGVATILSFSLLLPNNVSPSNSISNLLIRGIIIVISSAILPLMIGRIFTSIKADAQVATAIQVTAVLQDGVFFFLIAMLGGIMPLYYISISNLASGISADVVDIVSIISIFIQITVALFWIVPYCLENNVNHFNKRKAESKKNIEDEPQNEERITMQMNGLRMHILFQNIFVLISLIPYSILIFIYFLIRNPKLNKYFPNSNNRTKQPKITQNRNKLST